MKVKVINIEAYWNDKRTEPNNRFERRCVVMPLNATDAQRDAVLDDIGGSIFYIFDEDELIIGEHLDFTVYFYTPVGEIEIGEMNDDHEESATCMSCQDDIADYERDYCVYCQPEQFEDEGETK